MARFTITSSRLLTTLGLLSALGALVTLTGCKKTDDPTHGVQPGELGRGKFSYVCGHGADAQCNDNADIPIVDPSTNLPNVAVGSTFSVAYKSNADEAKGAGTGITQSGDLDLLAIDTSGAAPGYQAKRVGFVAVLGIWSGNEDLVHLKIVDVDHLEFANTEPTGGGSFKGKVTVPGLDLTLSSSSAASMLFRVVPLTKDRRLLAGALTCKWTTSDPTVLAIDGDDTQNILKTKLLKTGVAKLHVTLGAKSGDVTVTVGT